jgi:hypothetical protein
MPGLTFSNELISSDEGLYCDFACLDLLCSKLDDLADARRRDSLLTSTGSAWH